MPAVARKRRCVCTLGFDLVLGVMPLLSDVALLLFISFPCPSSALRRLRAEAL